MKKKILSLLLFCPLLAMAQMKVIAEGPSFDEPENGYARILMLKNGGTAYVHVTPKDGINVRIYNSQHREVAVKNIEPDYGKLKAMDVEGMYEVNGELNLFVSELDDAVPVLYRLRIDEQTGALKELKTLAQLNKANMGQYFASTYGQVPESKFIVHKDPLSDNYSVIRYNTFESDRAKRVELIQYAADGSEQSRTFLSSPDTKYKYTQFLDFAVVGSEVYALLYSYNTATSGGAANELLMASVKDGQVDYSNIGQSIKHRINDGILRYNPVTYNLVFFTSEYLKSESAGWNTSRKVYNVVLNVIDPKGKTIKNNIPLSSSTIMGKYRKVFKDDDLNLMPEDLYINSDGSITLLLEDIFTKTYRNMSTGSTRTSITLQSSAVIRYSEDGKEISSALIPKSQTLTPAMFDYVSAGASTTGFSHMNAGNQYKGVFYFNGKDKSYIFMNDVAENSERIAKGRLTTIQSVGDCDAWAYDLSTNVSASLPIPTRVALFPKERSKDRNLALFGLSDFNGETGDYATLKLEKGRGKQVKMVWMN
jgi:hypothetical protein